VIERLSLAVPRKNVRGSIEASTRAPPGFVVAHGHDEGGIDAATAPAHSRRTMPAGFDAACRATEFCTALLLRFRH